MTATSRLRYRKGLAGSMTSTQEPAETNSKPLHIQVRETIRRQVRAGELIDKTGRLMTEAELGKHFGVSRITIRNAIKPLVDEGMFERERGRGTFLRTNQPENWVGRLMGFSETIKDAGYQPGAKVLLQGMTNKHDAEVRNRDRVQHQGSDADHQRLARGCHQRQAARRQGRQPAAVDRAPDREHGRTAAGTAAFGLSAELLSPQHQSDEAAPLIFTRQFNSPTLREGSQPWQMVAKRLTAPIS
jgi:DNA-binding transcriptional regulator YhcF (GntR family)